MILGGGLGDMSSAAGGSDERTMAELSELSPSGELRDGERVVEVTARRYEFVPEVIAVRAGDTVLIEATSQDVAHGLAIPEFDVDRRLEPGVTERIRFQAEASGRHPFHCSVYCGPGHAGMAGTLVVLPTSRPDARKQPAE